MSTLSPAELHERFKELIAARTPVAIATIVRGGRIGTKMLILNDQTIGTLGDASLDQRAAADARQLLLDERSSTNAYEVPGATEPVEVFLETFPAPPVLLIFGAVHVAQALSMFAKSMGYDVIVVDIRAKLATEERFPHADQIIHAWPDDALKSITIHPNTYIAILSHDPKFDEPALLGALNSPAGYIGAIGSRKTNVDRRQRLAEAGVSPEQIARVRGPIGLDIGAESPEEMAISILAELIAVRRGRSGGFLADKSGHIRGPREDEPAPTPEAAPALATS
jgi:xanthine dehydrogenase accessory factor